MSETGNSPYSLQRLTIPILNKAHCQEGYRALGISKPFNQCQICAGDPKGGKDACQVILNILYHLLKFNHL